MICHTYEIYPILDFLDMTVKYIVCLAEEMI